MNREKLIEKLKTSAQDNRRICEEDEIFAEDVLELLSIAKEALQEASRRMANISDMCCGDGKPHKDIYNEAYHGPVRAALRELTQL